MTRRIRGYLKIDGVPGGATERSYEDQIVIHGLEFEMAAPNDPGNLARTGRVRIEPIRIAKYYDPNSIHLIDISSIL